MTTAPRTSGLRGLAAALALVLVGSLWSPPAEAQVVTQTPVMKGPVMTQAQLASWFRAQTRVTYRALVPLDELIRLFYEEGAREGVAPDIAFVQSVLETGWFSFEGSQVRPEDNNFAGIGAVDGGGGSQVARFPSARIGVRAQMHHLRGYADPTVGADGSGLASPNESPRFHLIHWSNRGQLTFWEDFGGRNEHGATRWASDPYYSEKILYGGTRINADGTTTQLRGLYGEALVFNGYPRHAAIRANRILGASPPPGAVAVTGDWNADGVDTPGWFRDGQWALFDRDGTITRLAYGRAGDTPLVGDWNGDGRDTVGVVRDNHFILRRTYVRGDDVQLRYGRATDTPVAGDWNGDGTDTIGVVRGNQWILRYRYRSGSDIVLDYGRASDTPVTGDWNGDGTDTIGVVRDGTWILRYRYRSGSDIVMGYGRASDHAVTGDWNGDGTDTIGVRRGEEWHLRYRYRSGADFVYYW